MRIKSLPGRLPKALKSYAFHLYTVLERSHKRSKSVLLFGLNLWRINHYYSLLGNPPLYIYNATSGKRSPFAKTQLKGNGSADQMAGYPLWQSLGLANTSRMISPL